MANSLRDARIELELQDDGCISLTDRASGRTWSNRSPGTIELDDGHGSRRISLKEVASTGIERKGGGLTLTYRNGGELAFELVIRFALAGGELRMTIESLQSDHRLVQLVYPFALGVVRTGVDSGYVVLPYNQGALIPSRLESGFMRCKHNTWAAISDVEASLPFWSKRLNMPWYGVSVEGASLYCEVETPADCSLSILGNIPFDFDALRTISTRDGSTEGERISALSPVWRASAGGLGTQRRMVFAPVEGGYVGMCGRYRRSAEAGGLAVSLKEKAEANPLVERMIGATDIKTYVYTHRLDRPILRAFSEPVLDGYERCHTTFAQVSTMMEELRASGVERALFLLGGWNRAGYDREHVDMWPPAEPAGGAAGLASLAEDARSRGYILALHDNYQDFYPDAPSYDERVIMKDRSGAIRRGGIWDGGLCHLICSRESLGLMRRNLDQILGSAGITGYYLDTITSAALYECYDPAHPLRREDDRVAKAEVQKHLIERGLVVGGEGGVDWAVPTTVFFEGVPGAATGYTTGVETPGFGIAVPLFNMVYHDCIIQYWQHGQPFGRFDHSSHVLHNVLTAQPANFSIIHEQWASVLPQIVQCDRLLGRLHRETAHVRMSGHRFLNEDFTVQEASYADGTVVRVNFGFEPHGTGAGAMAPRAFSIVYADGEAVSGRFPPTFVPDDREGR